MTGKTILHKDTYTALNACTDNVFIADNSLTLTWMNNAAKELITMYNTELKIDNAEDLFQKKLADMHPHHSRFHKVMNRKDAFPHQANIIIFNDYRANITVNRLKDGDNNEKGFILFWKDITKEEELKQKDRKLIGELSTPVLPSLVENCLVVPLIGMFNESRIDHLTHTLLSEVVSQGADYILFDMSSVTGMDEDDSAVKLNNLFETVKLMGAEVFFADFTKEHAKYFISKGTKFPWKTFPHYRQAMQYIISLEGYELIKKPTRK